MDTRTRNNLCDTYSDYSYPYLDGLAGGVSVNRSRLADLAATVDPAADRKQQMLAIGGGTRKFAKALVLLGIVTYAVIYAMRM